MSKTLTERDQQVIWHPYTQHKNNLPPIPVVQGKGSLLFDDKGNSYIDAISSWWVNIHGHGHPYIAEKVYEQAQKLEHVIFTGFTHEPAVQLAEKLLPLLPGVFSKVFYSDNGSTAVEVAIKMAIQYWSNSRPSGTQPVDLAPSSSGDQHVGSPSPASNNQLTGPPSSPSGNQLTSPGSSPLDMQQPPAPRSRILAFRHSYHGDTFGAMSISERSVFTAAFRDYLFDVIFIDTPTKDNIGELKSFIARQAGEIACFIYEPLLQAAGGMLMYEAGLLDELLDTVASHSIISIADEVLTGFGRTGRLFAGDYLHHKANIICLSKGLTGGTMALGVTAVTENIFQAFLSDDKHKTLFHGHSFTANPLACASALASLDLLKKDECIAGIQAIAERHLQFAKCMEKFPAVRNVRTLGTVIAFEINAGKDGYINSIGAAITAASLKKGIYLRPLGNTVYLMPPYCITQKELDQVYEFLVQYIEKI
jgi:adenosylmethionine---8-amino-7-oxononanoate aminotransferase